MTDEAIAVLAPRIGTRAACAASGVPQATWCRRRRAHAATSAELAAAGPNQVWSWDITKLHGPAKRK